MRFLRAILNKTKEDRTRNTDIRLELEVDEIKSDIQKSRLRWFGYMMRMREQRIPKKMLHTQMEENNQEEDPEPDGQGKLQGYRNERGTLGRSTRKQEMGVQRWVQIPV